MIWEMSDELIGWWVGATSDGSVLIWEVSISRKARCVVLGVWRALVRHGQHDQRHVDRAND
jgi:hypothetical protein